MTSTIRLVKRPERAEVPVEGTVWIGVPDRFVNQRNIASLSEVHAGRVVGWNLRKAIHHRTASIDRLNTRRRLLCPPAVVEQLKVNLEIAAALWIREQRNMQNQVAIAKVDRINVAPVLRIVRPQAGMSSGVYCATAEDTRSVKTTTQPSPIPPLERKLENSCVN